MLFIHDNDPHVSKRSEDGRAGPHGYLHLSLPDSPPLIVTLSPSKPAVKKSKVLSESILDSGEKLRGQGYLRNQDNRFLALGQHFFNGSNINLRLSAPSDAVNQKRRKSLRMDSL